MIIVLLPKDSDQRFINLVIHLVKNVDMNIDVMKDSRSKISESFRELNSLWGLWRKLKETSIDSTNAEPIDIRTPIAIGPRILLIQRIGRDVGWVTSKYESHD